MAKPGGTIRPTMVPIFGDKAGLMMLSCLIEHVQEAGCDQQEG